MTALAVHSSLPELHHAFAFRGGAFLLAASKVAVSKQNDDVNLLFGVPPTAKAVLCMAIAMSLHYLGYSLARPSTIAIFTSLKTGYKSPAAFPFAMAFVSPLSLLLLMGYAGLLENHGPRGALSRTTFLCASVLFLAAVCVHLLQDSSLTLFSVPLVKYISGPLFVFRESYVQLITSQYWSFMSSILNPDQSARWFAPISGLTSITSALAGLNVSFVVDKLGLSGAILGTSAVMVLSLFWSSTAYGIANRHGFDPSGEIMSKKEKTTTEAHHHESLLTKATNLFRRVPTLWALFVEVLACQGLATMLNIVFVAKLSSTISDDAHRAGWMGKYFALINVITMLLQFSVLPSLMQVVEPRDLWRVLPIIVLCFSGYQSTKMDPSLYIVSASLLTMKTLEYSARRMLDEMVYVPLDFESRYVGKEVVGVLAYRMGKSLMSLSLSGLTALFGNFGLQQLSLLSTGSSVLWLATAWKLSNLVPTRKEAADLYNQERKKT